MKGGGLCCKKFLNLFDVHVHDELLGAIALVLTVASSHESKAIHGRRSENVRGRTKSSMAVRARQSKRRCRRSATARRCRA